MFVEEFFLFLNNFGESLNPPKDFLCFDTTLLLFDKTDGLVAERVRLRAAGLAANLDGVSSLFGKLETYSFDTDGDSLVVSEESQLNLFVFTLVVCGSPWTVE